MADYRDLDGKMIRLAKQSLKMCAAAGSGHPSSALSLAHLTTALMYRVMRYDPKDPWNTGSDRLILSEGHAVPIVYAAYCDLEGVAGTREKPVTLKFDDALTLREADSLLDGHPSPAVGFPFFDAATGSLGQGLSVAAGLAGAARLDGSDRKIYCIIGDGESREGQIWEAVDFVVDHKLTAVRMIFNCNGQGQSDYVSQQQSAELLEKKLLAFGCEVKVIDGHDWDEVITALEAAATDKPIAIIAKTVKGWGSTELQSKNYHGKPIKGELLDQAIADLDAIAAKLGASEDAQAFAASKPAKLSKKADGGRISAGSFAAAMKDAGLEKALEAKKLATRRAYGVALAALGAADERVVAMDGDVQGSTFANMFAAKYGDRYFEARIAEQNMISAAAGLAAADKIPFVSSFAKFLVRGYDQLELAVISRANIKLCGSHAGVSLAADGPSQMGLPDMAFIRSFAHAQNGDGTPAITAFCPSDAVSAFKLTELMANTQGVCYMRTHRPDVEFLYDEDDSFEVGGFKKLTDGGDLVIVGSGYMVHIAKAAMKILAKAGVSATLVDAYSMPLQTDGILELGSSCNGRILVVEDNYIGGIADEVTAAAARSGESITVESMFVRKVPKSARTPEETLAMVGLTVDDIAGAAQAMCK
ncbi:MAG: transketolase [Sedimentisphaerales bacterium]|nr:transketolase [Sedimentisphaerales bacterium]